MTMIFYGGKGRIKQRWKFLLLSCFRRGRGRYIYNLLQFIVNMPDKNSEKIYSIFYFVYSQNKLFLANFV